MDTEVAGILGNNILNKTAYQVDWNRNVLTLNSRSSSPPPDAIPISVRNNRVYFKGWSTSGETEFAWIPGYRSTLAKDELKRLAIPLKNKARLMPPRSTSTRRNTSSSTSPTGQFPGGPIKRTNYTMLTWDHNVVGMDLLAPWILTVDARHGWLSLSAPPP